MIGSDSIGYLCPEWLGIGMLAEETGSINHRQGSSLPVFSFREMI